MPMMRPPVCSPAPPSASLYADRVHRGTTSVISSNQGRGSPCSPIFLFPRALREFTPWYLRTLCESSLSPRALREFTTCYHRTLCEYTYGLHLALHVCIMAIHVFSYRALREFIFLYFRALREYSPPPLVR